MANIKGITIEIEGKTTGLDKALKEVNKQAANTTKELGQVNRALRFNPGNAELVAQKQKLLGDQIKTTSEKLKGLKVAEQQVKQQFESGTLSEDKYRAFKREIIETESKLKTYQGQLSDVSKNQENLGKNTERLQRFFKATKTNVDDYADVLGSKLVRSIKDGTASSDDLEGAIEKIGKSALGAEVDVKELKDTLDGLGTNFDGDVAAEKLLKINKASGDASSSLTGVETSLRGIIATKAAEVFSEMGTKLVEFSQKSLEAFRTVDEGLDIMTAKTGKSADEFKTEFENLYSSIAVDDTAIVGSALGEINTQLDFTGKKLEKAAGIAIKYAQINGVDVTDGIMSAKSALEAYELGNDDFAGVLDNVTATSQRTGVSVDKLLDSAIKGAPQIKGLNLSFSEGVEVLGQLQKAGVDGDATLTSLTKASAIYAKEGLNLKEGLAQTVKKIKESKNETEAYNEAVKIFGTKGASRMVDAIKRGALNFKNLSKEAGKAGGTIESTFDKMVDPIDKQQVAMQNINLAMSEFGAAISEALLPILEAIIPIIQAVAEWFRNLPEPVKQGAVVFGLIAVAITAILPIIVAFVAAAGAAGVTVGAFIAGLLPIVGIVAGIAAAIAGLIAIFLNWDSVVNFLSTAWTLFKENLSAVWNFLLEAGKGFADGITKSFNGMKDSISQVWTNIVNATKEKFESIKKAISDKIEGAKKAVSDAIEKIKGFFNFKISWPKIPMPHFSINPPGWKIGDLLKGSIPSLGVEFYAKGGIMTRPTAFGMNGNNVMVGGEAGPEAVLPLNRRNLGAIGAGIANTLQEKDYSEVLLDIRYLLEQLLQKDNHTYLDSKDLSKGLYDPFNRYSESQSLIAKRFKGEW